MNAQLLTADNRDDHRGALAIYDPLPFTPVRAFVIHETARDIARGHHAHRTCTEALCATHGAVHVVVSDGVTEARYLLDTPSTLLVLPPHHWIDLVWFSPSASLLVLADRPYDASDYILDRSQFFALVAAA